MLGKVGPVADHVVSSLKLLSRELLFILICEERSKIKEIDDDMKK